MTEEKARKYYGIALAIAELSKDTSTKVGAVIIGPNGEGGPWGYNGAPRGCSADEPDDPRGGRPEKYYWMAHGEANAIANAARSGFATLGCTLVCTHFPCMGCARDIVQAGIKQVLCPSPEGEFAERWAEDIKRSRLLFAECGVGLVLLSSPP